MSDGDESRPDLDEDESAAEIDDDFLFHLYQGGELLRGDRVVEAKDHLERAFQLKPTNARGQNLLGLVYFRLGLYQRAIEVYQDLVERFPEEATLRVNLAMVHFKADQLDQAETELRQAIALEPEHRNAHRYLGLVLVRQGQTDEARRHFGQAGVKNAERLLGAEVQGDVSPQRSEEIRQAQNRALAEVADQGFRELEDKEFPFRNAGPGSEPPPPAAEEDAGGDRLQSERWRATEVGRGRSTRPGAADRAGFSLEGEQLSIRCPGSVHTRLESLVWIEGDLSLTRINKRFGGQATRHGFDRGPRAMVRVEGEGALLLDPLEMASFALIEHGDASGYFLEQLVFAFGDSSAWENGRLAVGEGEADLPIFHLYGPTRLVLSCPGKPMRRSVSGERRVCLPARKLIGWWGNLAPRLFQAELPLPTELWLELTGDGEILYTV